jgi:hypothetical protein
MASRARRGTACSTGPEFQSCRIVHPSGILGWRQGYEYKAKAPKFLEHSLEIGEGRIAEGVCRRRRRVTNPGDGLEPHIASLELVRPHRLENIV